MNLPAKRVAARFLRVADNGTATPLAKQHWSRLKTSDRFEWLVGFFGDRPGGKTWAAQNETNPSLQGIMNEAGELWNWDSAGEFGEAVDEEAKDHASGKPTPATETREELNLESVLSKYVGDSRMMNTQELVFLREAILDSRVAPGVRVLERIQADDPGWRKGEHVKFSVASFSATEFSKGKSAGNIGWKSTDKCIVRVENPRRGLTVSYAGRDLMKMQFDAAAERETLLGGAYTVIEVEQIVEPHTTPVYGYRIPLYHLRES
jgi:hypothetical protein